jgi:hypothetical protein
MQPAEDLYMRAYSPSEDSDAAEPRVMTVTVTESCACKPTPSSKHISQIPVNVPASSSMGGLAAASSPAYSNSVMVGASSSSVLYGSMSATPTPSGASANRFHTFTGAAPQVNAAQGGVAALGVAAVMGLMIAL